MRHPGAGRDPVANTYRQCDRHPLLERIATIQRDRYWIPARAGMTFRPDGRAGFQRKRFTHPTYLSTKPCRNFRVSSLEMFPAPSIKPSLNAMNTSGCASVGTST